MRDLFSEMRRRKVVRTAIIYAALAWGAIEVVTTLLPVFGGRDTVVRVLVALILLGLPVAVVVSWMFDLTPEGVTRDSPDGTSRRSDSAPHTDSGSQVVSIPPPAPATPLLSRDDELRQLAGFLEDGSRVVTITGPGGTGKTRLAVGVADRVVKAFPGGLAFIELAAVSEAGDVIPAIAAALGVKEAETRSLDDGLATVIGDRRVLLVLDNVEQVLGAASQLMGLVRRCPGLHVLTTSRARLRVSGEVEFPLQPLSLPPSGVTPALEDLETFGAVELFLDRTKRARPDFALTADNAHTVLAICRKLDGLPLALELAAARLRALDAPTLLGKLGHALDTLTSGARDLPERQRTLRGTIDWSHSLLEDDEKLLFRRLAVFSGGWPLDAIGPVCSDGDPTRDNLELLESLVEKGLVRTLGDARYGMYETIREYAIEQLAQTDEANRIRRRHADHYLDVVVEMYRDFRGPAQIESFRQGDVEAANVEAALEVYWRAAGAGDPSATRGGLALCGHLWMYWHVRGLHFTAREWSRRFLELTKDTPGGGMRAPAFVTAAVASLTLGDISTCLAEVDEGERFLVTETAEFGPILAISRGVAHLTAGEVDRARPALEAAARDAEQMELSWEWALATAFLGVVESASANPEVARRLFDEALKIQRDLGDHEGGGLSLGGHAALEAAAGRYDSALALYQEAFDSYHAIGDRPEEARILDAYAWTALSAGRGADARESFAESLRAYEEVGSVRGIGLALLGLAATEAAAGRPERALRIAGAADAFSELEGIANDYAVSTAGPQYLEPVRQQVGPTEVDRLKTEGRALTVREAVRYALDPEYSREVELVRN